MALAMAVITPWSVRKFWPKRFLGACEVAPDLPFRGVLLLIEWKYKQGI
jgi:hypothetical protein